PARHNIFDFLNRNLKSYMPELSSSRVNGSSRVWKIGKWRIPLSGPSVEMRRKSQTCWKILGDQGIASTILRVPITFPPEEFNGRLLSAMCTPDLLGTQGSFTQFTTQVEQATFESGSRYPLKRAGDELHGVLSGPENSMIDGGSAMQVPFVIRQVRGGEYRVEIGGESHPLRVGDYSPWLKLAFP